MHAIMNYLQGLGQQTQGQPHQQEGGGFYNIMNFLQGQHGMGQQMQGQSQGFGGQPGGFMARRRRRGLMQDTGQPDTQPSPIQGGGPHNFFGSF